MPLLIHQPSYSMLNRWVEEDLLDVLGETGVGCIAFSPLAQGMLTTKYLNGIPGESRAAQGKSLRTTFLNEDNLARIRGLNGIAERRGQTLAQMALAWVLRDQRVTSVLIGASSVEQLDDNLAALENLEISDDDWRRYFEVNVLAATRLIRTYLPGMTARGWGRVLDIASDSAVVIPAEMIHYGMSKTALLAVSRGFAKEAAGTGVTVNSVIAGPTHTGGVEGFVRELVGDDLPWDEAQRKFMISYRPQSLLQRLIEPEEIAHLVTYLASPLASATTGAAVRVDGGYVDSIIP